MLESRALRQPVVVDQAGIPPGAPLLEGRGLAATVEAVAIAARTRRVPGVEVSRRLLGGHDRDVGGKERVERLCDPRRRGTAGDLDAGDVAERVDAGVRATRDGKRVPAREDRRERLADDALDRP
jgi:hypothetical protein